MKKKVIVPIVLSSIALLLGGLIYLGISSFPELLESEDSIKAKEANAPVLNDDTIVFEEEKLFAPKAVETTPSLSGGSNYIPLSFSGDVIYIDAPVSSYEGKASIEVSKPSFTETFVFDFHSFFPSETTVESTFGDIINAPSETITEQPAISNGHVSRYSYNEESDETARLETNKVKKAKVNKNKTIRSNEALIETSLLVIGAIDIISMILIYRRKHLFR